MLRVMQRRTYISPVMLSPKILPNVIEANAIAINWIKIQTP